MPTLKIRNQDGSWSPIDLTNNIDLSGKADLVDGKVPVEQLPALEEPVYFLDPTTTSEGNPYVAKSNGEGKIVLRYPNGFSGTKQTAFIILPSKNTNFTTSGGVSVLSVGASLHNDSDVYIDTSTNITDDGVALVIYADEIFGLTHHNFSTEGKYISRPAGFDKGFVLGAKSHNEFEYYYIDGIGAWTVSDGDLSIMVDTPDTVDGWGHTASLTSSGALKRYTLNQQQYNKLNATSSGDAILMTYAQLKDLKDSNGLTINQRYILVDYHTKYVQPNHSILKVCGMSVYDMYGNPAYTTDYSSFYEPLVLTAISANAFDTSVTSTLHPEDKIIYDFDDHDITNNWNGHYSWVIERCETLPAVIASYNSFSKCWYQESDQTFYRPIYPFGQGLTSEFGDNIDVIIGQTFFKMASLSDMTRPGRILRRKDTLRKFDLPYDFRNVWTARHGINTDGVILGHYNNWWWGVQDVSEPMYLDPGRIYRQQGSWWQGKCLYLYQGPAGVASEYRDPKNNTAGWKQIANEYNFRCPLNGAKIGSVPEIDPNNPYRIIPAPYITREQLTFSETGWDGVRNEQFTSSNFIIEFDDTEKEWIPDILVGAVKNVKIGGRCEDVTSFGPIIDVNLTGDLKCCAQLNGLVRLDGNSIVESYSYTAGLLNLQFKNLMGLYCLGSSDVKYHSNIFRKDCTNLTTLGNIEGNEFNGVMSSVIFKQNFLRNRIQSDYVYQVLNGSQDVTEVGFRNNVSGNVNTVFGSLNVVQKNNNLVLGESNNVNGIGNTIIGTGNTVVGTNDVVLGSGLTLNGFRNFVIGRASLNGIERGAIGSTVFGWGTMLPIYSTVNNTQWDGAGIDTNGTNTIYFPEEFGGCFRRGDYIRITTDVETHYSQIMNAMSNFIVMKEALQPFTTLLEPPTYTPMPIAIYRYLEDVANNNSLPLKYIDPLTYRWSDEGILVSPNGTLWKSTIDDNGVVTWTPTAGY